MKTISIISKFDYDECIKILLNNISVKDKTYLYFIPSIFKKDEIIGNIKGNQFWLCKTKPNIYYGLFRIFTGKIAIKECNICITGKFRFPWFVRIIDVMLLIALIAILITPGTIYVVPLLLAIIFIIGYHLFNILSYKKDELELISFLESLYKD